MVGRWRHTVAHDCALINLSRGRTSVARTAAGMDEALKTGKEPESKSRCSGELLKLRGDTLIPYKSYILNGVALKSLHIMV